MLEFTEIRTWEKFRTCVKAKYCLLGECPGCNIIVNVNVTAFSYTYMIYYFTVFTKMFD